MMERFRAAQTRLVAGWRMILAEPAVADPPGPRGCDFALASLFSVLAIVEASFRPDLPLRALSTLAVMVLTLTLLQRRVRPLAMFAIMMVAVNVMDVVSILTDGRPLENGSAAYILLLIFALYRWGSGRHGLIGVGLMLLAWLESQITSYSGVGDAIGGMIVLLLPVALGTTVRYQTTARRGQVEAVRLNEREQLARELHDTVAHHVSAIAIQAQAGRTIAPASGPTAEVFATIEEEASRALEEMRTMIGLLRDRSADPELTPRFGLADVEQLAASIAPGGSPRVRVTFDGPFEAVRPSVQAALYRIAQEALTNAIRHGRGVRLVEVGVRADHDEVEMTVRDDGRGGSVLGNPGGYGLVGMSERASLFGGSLSAGPGSGGAGWMVRAVLPRQVQP